MATLREKHTEAGTLASSATREAKHALYPSSGLHPSSVPTLFTGSNAAMDYTAQVAIYAISRPDDLLFGQRGKIFEHGDQGAVTVLCIRKIRR